MYGGSGYKHPPTFRDVTQKLRQNLAKIERSRVHDRTLDFLTARGTS